MAPDQESGSGQMRKRLEDVCDTMSPIENNDLAEDMMNGCTQQNEDDGDDVGGAEDLIPEPEPDLCDDIRLEWFQVHRVGAGLANLGNTCFLNTVIQCLTYCPPLANYLLQNDHASTCQSFEFCMMCELQKHVKEALEHPGDVIEPIQIYENIKLIAEHFQSGQQEDAHEFLRFVIENLRRATNLHYCSSERLDSAIKETTVVNYIFGGYNRSQVVCLRCKKMSNTYEHCMDLILDIKHNASSLERALEQYVKPEILEKDNAYNCPRCKALVTARKTYTIHRAPNVATIQLKRFDYNKSHGGKIMKYVSYPELLDLRPFMSEKTDMPIMYRLNAVLVHVGQSCNSGHYYCYIRNSNGNWYLMDDARVQRVSLKDVLDQQAYLLFYVRTVVSGRTSNKKNVISVKDTNGLTKGDSGNQTAPSTDSSHKRKLYMPISKWVSSRKNSWSDRRKQNSYSAYCNSKRGNSHGSSSSSQDGEKSHCSRESSSSANSVQRGDNYCRFNGDGGRADYHKDQRFCNNDPGHYANGNVQKVNSECDNRLAYPVSFNGQSRQHASSRWTHNGYSANGYTEEGGNGKNWHSYNGRNGYGFSTYNNRNNGNYWYPPGSGSQHYHRYHLDRRVPSQGCRNDKFCNSAIYTWKAQKESTVPKFGENYANTTFRGPCRNGSMHTGYMGNVWTNGNGYRTKQSHYYSENRFSNFQERSSFRRFDDMSKQMGFSFSHPRHHPYSNSRRLQNCY